jgi:hypothetical protein
MAYFKTNLKRVMLAVCIGMSGVCGTQVIGLRTLTIQELVRLTQENSISAISNRNTFAASYWSSRSYMAQLLPLLNLSARLAQFNRSLVALHYYNTGVISYHANYNMSNDVSFNFRKNIPWTSGTIHSLLSCHIWTNTAMHRLPFTKRI